MSGESLESITAAGARDRRTTPGTLYATQYVYDNLGNLTRMIRAANDRTYNRTTDYLYDGSRHLRQEVQWPSWPLSSPTLVTAYTYDGNGNRASLVDPLSQTTTFTFDYLNRLTGISYSDGVTPNVTYTYDANGNRVTMVDGIGTTSYAYDEMDRLQSVTSPGSSVVSYRYDLAGNRAKDPGSIPNCVASCCLKTKPYRRGTCRLWTTGYGIGDWKET